MVCRRHLVYWANTPELQVFFAYQDRPDIPDEDFAPQFDRESLTIIAQPHRSCFHLVIAEEFAGGSYLLEPQIHPEAFQSSMDLPAEDLDTGEVGTGERVENHDRLLAHLEFKAAEI